jgi:ribonuclease HI
MYFDGSLKLQGAGAGILFIAPGGEQLKNALQLLFSASNNAAEYEALIHGLNIAISLGIKRLMVYEDSLVVISQINKEWDCSNDSMGKYCTCNALNLGVEFFILFSHQIQALLFPFSLFLSLSLDLF